MNSSLSHDQGGALVRGARPSHPMLPAGEHSIVSFPPTLKPQLVVIIDAEEGFNWNKPFSRTAFHVDTSEAQGQSCRIFERFGIKPSYAVDYPVAAHPSGYKPLLELLQSDRCEIGGQLHSWVTPPHEELVSEENSYANNLPASLERRKIVELTQIINTNFGIPPRLYRGGRYGAGSATLQILGELGYQVDCSVLPGMKRSAAAPDYSGATERPYWLGNDQSILELPVTVGTVGLAGRKGERTYRHLASPLGTRLKLPAVAARLGIVERIRLTPEGSTISEAKRLTRRLLGYGAKVFAVSYHSPSLEPGNTPYVRDRRDLYTFLNWLEEYFMFFLSEMNGEASTPLEVRRLALELQHGERFRLP